jgi:Raf kinase inhibitor-like YbhB/YbcL family protein
MEKPMKPIAFIRLVLFVLGGFFMTAALSYDGDRTMALILKSPDFTHNGEIPKIFTCDGDDISPTLSWSGLPPKAKSLALIVDDPDAPDPANPKMTWVHWLLYNIPATVAELPKGIAASALPTHTLQGKNDWNRTGYGGPCPPIGKHRYFHKLYVLDIELPDLRLPTKAQLEQAMAGHIIERTELIGTYQRQLVGAAKGDKDNFKEIFIPMGELTAANDWLACIFGNVCNNVQSCQRLEIFKKISRSARAHF